MEPSPIKSEQKPLLYQRSWGPLAAILVSLATYFGAQVVAGIFIYLVVPAFTHVSLDTMTKSVEQSAVLQFLTILLVEVITVGCVLWFLRRRHASVADIGLKKPRFKDAGFALVGFGVYLPLFLVSMHVAQVLFPTIDLNQKQDLGFSTSTTGVGLWLIFISLVILPPIAEEILCRGFLYTGLHTKLKKVPAMLVTSALFAAAHLQFGSGNKLLWIAALDTFILSLVLVDLRDRTDSLWPGIGLHMIKNALAFASLFVFHL